NDAGSWPSGAQWPNTSPDGPVADTATAAAALKRWSVQAGAGSTLSTLATELAALINADYSGTSASGSIITCPAGAAALKAYVGGEEWWVSYSVFIEPSPVSASNTSEWGPITGQFKQTATGAELSSPPLSLNMMGESQQVLAQTTYWTPVNYSTYQRKLADVSAANFGRGEWHHVVMRYRDGQGVDTEIPAGYPQTSVFGPNYDGTHETRTGTGMGLVQIWIDGTPVVDLTNIPTGYIETTKGYFKAGIYRHSVHAVGDSMVVWFANLELQCITTGGASLAARVENPLPIYGGPAA
ncbi:heparin lyase I family protein, partial [Xanthobacter autotrophicus]|uniref:heparin lyase I family protein n=1 Tax=Xanthobacter autotrophicus TaxID=280 RepID=UPI003727B2F3